MNIDLKIEDVAPFLPTLNSKQTAQVTARLPVLSLLLDARYSSVLTPDNRVLFVSTAADALERRLAKPAGLIDSQSMGPASVKYSPRAALSRWFLPEELDQLDDACGLGGGIRSVRIPAPDAVRFGNTTSIIEQIEASGAQLAEEN